MGFRNWTLQSVVTTAVVIGSLCAFPVQANEDQASASTTGFTPPQDPMTPIEVGPRDDVGKESLGKKAGKKVAGGILGAVLGGGSSRSKSKGPKTYRDPTRKLDYAIIEKKDLDLEIGARAKWTDDGLLVSNSIEEADDKGTFQTIFLQDCQGRRMYPARLELYKIWVKHKLTVSWTKTTTVDGQVVSQESGGWTESWIEDLGTFSSANGEQPVIPAIWQQLGYSRAQAGARELGTYFNLTPEDLKNAGQLALFSHITRPEEDPVTTEPFNWLISSDGEDVSVDLPDAETANGNTAWEQWTEQCPTQTTPSQRSDEGTTPPDDSGDVTPPDDEQPSDQPTDQPVDDQPVDSQPGQTDPVQDDNETTPGDGSTSIGDRAEDRGRQADPPGSSSGSGTGEQGSGQQADPPGSSASDQTGRTTSSVPPRRGDRETVTSIGGITAATPCQEALVAIDRSKKKFEADLNGPLAALEEAMKAADALAAATTAEAKAQANYDAEKATLDAMNQFLEDWDNWFNDKLERLEQHRERVHGTREPDWASGSKERSTRKHERRTEELRQEIEKQEAAVTQAQQALNQAKAATKAAQGNFNNALQAFIDALAGLRNAKDEFVDLVVMHFRCSPCRVIANHWASAARLKDLLNRMKAMLAGAQARTQGQLNAAQAAADTAKTAADAAKQELSSLENRRTEIEQELRDAVRADDDCISHEPQEGWGWINLAAMDGVRSNIVAAGSVQVYRSNFKGSDVRVYIKPGCLRERIERINWRKVNELNEELATLQSEIDAAREAAREAQRAAALAQAQVAGLQAKLNALNQLAQALANSGLEQNTDDVLEELDELSKDCNKAIKEAINGASEARRRANNAANATASGEGKRRGLRNRANRAGNDLDNTSTEGASDADKAKHEELKRRADELGDDSNDEDTPRRGSSIGSAPDTVDEAERRRRQAEADARRAENKANELEGENEELEDDVKQLEDEIAAHKKHLADWRRYWAALKRYEDCLREKQKAAQELAELNTENASALQELANLLGDAADGIKEGADLTSDLESASEDLEKANKKAKDLAGKLARISNAMEVLDAVFRADDLTPSEKLEAMSKAFEELREWLPDLPGVTQMLEFYNEAMKAIAGKLGEIEDRLTESWADLVEAGIADPDDAPIGIREEVRKVAKIRELMKILSRNCGEPPTPPQSSN